MLRTEFVYDTRSLQQLDYTALEAHVNHAQHQFEIAKEDIDAGATDTAIASAAKTWAIYYHRANDIFLPLQQQRQIRQRTLHEWINRTPVLRRIGRKGVLYILVLLYLSYTVSGIGLGILTAPPAWGRGDGEARCFATPCACPYARSVDHAQLLLEFQLSLLGALLPMSRRILWTDGGWISSARNLDFAFCFSALDLFAGSFFAALGIYNMLTVRASYGLIASSCFLSSLM